MSAKPTELLGFRILVLEDSFLVAEAIRVVLEDGGHVVIGPTPRVKEALEMLVGEKLDGAILDINLGGDYCFPVAAALLERGVPFVFCSGYDNAAIVPESLRHVPFLPKPFEDRELIRFVAEHLVGGRPQPID